MTKIESTDSAKAEKIVRVPYIEAAPANELNAEGLLTVVPQEIDGKYHLVPKSTDFADQAIFLEWRAVQAEETAQSWVEKAKSYRTKASAFSKYGNPKTRTAILRREKIMRQLAELDELLLDEGVDVNELPDDEG